jgi:hypothetical protein
MRGASGVTLVVLLVARASVAAPTPLPEPTVPFGRVVYRATRAASFGSLGVTMIACRHRDPVSRRFVVQFFDRAGRPISPLGNIPASPPTPAGQKVVFVTDGTHFVGDDVLNLNLGHLASGTARVVSDAEIVHCIGKIRMDAGIRSASYRDEIGFVREGEPLPELADRWQVPPRSSPRR